MSSIVTFYSYKGGVGRSMALANIAYELAKRNKKVLLIDWDLEAPGLERYFSNFHIDKSGDGLLSLLLQLWKDIPEDYAKYLWTIRTDFEFPIHFLHSGREKDVRKYSSELEKFDWDKFFQPNGGGIHLENMRSQWLKDYDIVLIDSRTGLSDASGVCTIMLPDIVIPMFTANFQSLFGIRDIMNLIQSARQRLSVDRMALTILPLPSRFGTRVEFKESQEWLDRIADILKDCFSDWLPEWIEPRYVLEQVKIPQVDYFGFGEKLAVVEQGTNDPEGLGFIYAKIADLLSSDFTDIQNFVGKAYYDRKKADYEKRIIKETPAAIDKGIFKYDLYISYPRSVYQWVKETMMPALTEYLGDELNRNPQIFLDVNEVHPGASWSDATKYALESSKTYLFVFANTGETNDFVNNELIFVKARQQVSKYDIVYSILLNGFENEERDLPSFIRPENVFDLSRFTTESANNSVKLRSKFGAVIEDLCGSVARSIRNLEKETIEVASENISRKDIKGEIESLAVAYESLRKAMASGSNRTRLMQDIVEKMKAKATEVEEILPSLVDSSSAGERLAAISALHSMPKLEYVNWLAEHVGDGEKPFIGYQASVGLYIASRDLGAKNKEFIAGALDKALNNLNDFKDPNQISILNAALKELNYK